MKLILWHLCVCLYVCVCVRSWERACMRTCVHACACVFVWACPCTLLVLPYRRIEPGWRPLRVPTLCMSVGSSQELASRWRHSFRLNAPREFDVKPNCRFSFWYHLSLIACSSRFASNIAHVLWISLSPGKGGLADSLVSHKLRVEAERGGRGVDRCCQAASWLSAMRAECESMLTHANVHVAWSHRAVTVPDSSGYAISEPLLRPLWIQFALWCCTSIPF